MSCSPVPVVQKSNNANLSAGHVFPEFKESDAMFAAERVSAPTGKGTHPVLGKWF